MIALTKMRELPISAASGLVIVGDKLYVIADDELSLSVFSLHDANYHHSIRLFSGTLPEKKKARKKHKPDLEALAYIAKGVDVEHGALLALGSGSKENRMRGVLIAFNADGTLNQAITELDMAPLYTTLPFADLNIEGAFVAGNQLVLMQRGNTSQPQSALVYCPLADVLQGLSTATIVQYTLPCVGEVPLGFTDGIYLPNGNILFTAVAENSDNSYADGPCAGAAIGEINAQGQLLRCDLLAQPYKVEGIAIAGEQLYAVTDADDASVPAELLVGAL